MTFFDIGPYFFSLGLLLTLAATPVFAVLDPPLASGGPRLTTLDGLRGFLALAVVFHHGAIYHRHLREGVWALPPSHFYAVLGQVGVALFFMITGYLFWSRMIATRGRPGWAKLYLGRVFRIAPLYLVAVLVMFVIVFAQTGLRLAVPVWQLIRQIGAWLALGALTGPLGGLGGPEVNGYRGTNELLAGVTWTLQYEWAFYCCLPILALAARQRWLHLPASAAGLLVSLALSRIYGIDLIYAALFFVGMTSASIHASGLHRAPPDHFASCLAVGLIVGTMFLYRTAYAVEPAVLLGTGFHLIASGGSVFGLLLTRPAQRLGHISYGIYLLQGLALAVVLRPTANIAISSPIWHWLLVLAASVLLVGVSAVLHVMIERPGIAFGKAVGARFDSVVPRRGFLLRAPSR